MRSKLILLSLAALVLLVLPAAADAAPSCATVGISGPSNVYAESSCVMPTWSAACSCPVSLFTPNYFWFIDDAGAGNGSSASQTYCPQSPPDAYTMTVQVVIICGRAAYFHSKSVFVSLCDNSGGTPLCLG